MPIFEYTCPNCGEAFEKIILNRSQPPPVCPKCGFKRVDRKLSVFATANPSPKSLRAACAPTGSG